MKQNNRLIFLLILLMSMIKVYAQHYEVKTLSLEHGLSCNFVVDATQDKNGFLWFATEEGLCRFDGARFFNYYKRKNRPQGISSSALNCVLDDRDDHVLWIGTKNDGLNALDYSTDEFLSYQHDAKNAYSIATNDITDIAHAENGNIWVATYWMGVEHLDKQTDRFSHYNTSNVKGLPDNQLWSVLDVGNGIVMAGHVKTGLSIIDTHRMQARHFHHDAANSATIAGNEVTAIYKDRNGVIWIGTNNGLDIYDPANQCFVHVAQDKIGSHRIFDIKEMSDGKLWVAIELNGIAIIDMEKKPYAASWAFDCQMISESQLSGSSVRCILEDKYHNVWAGLYGGGINFLTTTQPIFHQLVSGKSFRQNTLTENSVMGLAIDASGHLWVGLDGGGINEFSSSLDLMNTFFEDKALCVQAAHCDKQGKLWFATFRAGAYVRMPTGGFRQVMPEGKEDVRCFYEDTQGQMWVGTSDGIYLLDVNTLQVKHHYNVGNNLVRSITQDSYGRLWIGFWGIGVEVFDKQMKFVYAYRMTEKMSRRLPANDVNHVFRDSRKRIWIATCEGAVCVDPVHGGAMRLYDQDNGMANVYVRAITEDRVGNVWMSTNRGICCLRKGVNRMMNYNEKDHVVLANFNDGSVFHDKKGNIYFGSARGLCYFNPKNVLALRGTPEVHITSLSLIGNLDRSNDSIINLTNKQSVSLNYDENTFVITFNTQNYAINDRVEYSYMLQGMQDGWITTDEPQITLRDLPAGTYHLQVRSRIHNQPWSAELAKMKITICPPIWLSWWAKTIYFLCLVVVVVLSLRVYRRHLRLKYLLRAEKMNHEKEQKLNEERLRFFTNITHELRTPLTLILGPLDDISHSSEISKGVKHKLAVIHQSAVRLNELITQILEFRKTETDNRKLRVQRGNIVDAVHEISLKYEELAQKPNVAIHFVAPENPVEMYFDRGTISIIVDNLVSNAIKYTDQGSIDVSVERRRQGDKHLVDITVSDTGHGISSSALPHVFNRYYQENGVHQASGTGIGLALVKNLVMLHEGEIHVKSSLELGTSFIVTLDEQNVYPKALHGKEEKELEENKASKVEAKDAENGKPLMLIVEDNHEILDYVAESFSDDFEVVKAEDGKQGLALALDKIPDMIVSDIMMPQMDGNEMCRVLKKDIRTSHIPVILLTAKDSLEAKEEGYDAGADSYITKPFTSSLLKSRVNNLLQQRKRNQQILQASHGQEDVDKVKRGQLQAALDKMDQEFLDKLNKIIQENIAGDIDVNLLARDLAVSTSTLYRKMKALTGISTNEYIRKYKMQYAEHLLLEGKYTISEISFMVGMSSIAYFRRCFKAEYGEIPSEYLKRLKEKEEL